MLPLLLLLLGVASLCIHVVCNDADCHWIVLHEVLCRRTSAAAAAAEKG
jgi:hypothetical protein